MKIRLLPALLIATSCLCQSANRSAKPSLTLEEAFNYVQIQSVKLAPNGASVLIATRRANWKQERFERTLWLYSDGTLRRLTQSGDDHDPEWSPDGKWIAFLSGVSRQTPDRGSQSGTQLSLIASSGGNAFRITQEQNGIDAMAWSPDSSAIYYATKVPLTDAQKKARKQQWHDVIRFRAGDRGDLLLKLPLESALEFNRQPETPVPDAQALTPGTLRIAAIPQAVSDMAVSPDGTQVAFDTSSPSGRVERIQDDELYLVPANGGTPRQLTHNEASERSVQWSRDGRSLIFEVQSGSMERKYEDVEGRIYSMNPETGIAVRLGAAFPGSLSTPSISDDDSILSAAAVHTEVPVYVRRRAAQNFAALPSLAGTYASLSTAAHSPRIAFVYSAQQRPAEVYLADDMEHLPQAKPVTAFNALFNQRALPRGVPYHWTADDGTSIEGWLIYPPGKFRAPHLRMLTLIHGGPAAADGDHFRSDWYDWAVIAASNGWLVFRPNYRGSIGYGDRFMRQISPDLVSRPGKDIQEGVDALVREGIADPDQLTVGGYSYGGYMTNWLITQTGRFRAAVTGAGAVEHAVNWGNDDLTFDDAWYLGGAPWENEKNYNDQAALWQMNKVTTPVHMVVGGSDVRVASAESYLMERALHTLNVPNTLLIFPGEGHLLSKNPWHGRIKVREELAWLQRYTQPRQPSTSGNPQPLPSGKE